MAEKSVRGWLGMLVSAAAQCPRDLAAVWLTLAQGPEKHKATMAWLVGALGSGAAKEERGGEPCILFAASALLLWLLLLSPPIDGAAPNREQAVRALATWPQFTTQITTLAAKMPPIAGSGSCPGGSVEVTAASMLCLSALLELKGFW